MSACVDDESFLKGEERRVLSEVHSGRGDSNTRTCADPEVEVVISRYQYFVPAPSSVQVDDDGSKSSSSSGDNESEGDILIRRRRKRLRAASLHESCTHPHEVLTIVHKLATPVSLVGQQVWPAAFLLGDFILTHEELFAGANVLELGSGSGIAGLIAARVARQTFLTDYHDEILALIARNTEVNKHLIPCHDAGEDTPKRERESSLWRPVEVRKLDWLISPWTERTHDRSDQHLQNAVMSANHRRQGTSSFNWKCGELKRLLSTETANDRIVIIASDVIYDEDLTEAFFRTLETLMSSPQMVTIDTSSESNDRHATNLTAGHLLKRNAEDQEDTPSKIQTPELEFHHETGDKADISTEASPILYLALEKRFNFTIEDMSVVPTGYRALQRNVLDVTDGPITTSPYRQARERSFKFEGMRIPLSFKQCFRYPRDENMELWRIKLRSR